MRKQQRIWQEEHVKSQALPKQAGIEPASAVLYFADFLKSRRIALPAKIVDIGCGKGRHALYFAKLGFEVYAMDYIQEALDICQALAQEAGVSDKVHIYNSQIDAKWSFEDNFFDLALDSFASIDIETREGREIYRNEMLRTLKPRGFAMVSVVAAEDELEKEMMRQNPGHEKNSTIWPNGKFQKNYDEEELREFYKNFEIVELKKVKKPAVKLGRQYIATDFWLILKKHI